MLRSLLAIVLVLAFAFDLINAQENQSEIDLVHYGDVIDVDVVGSLDFDWRGTLNPEGFLDGMERIEDPVYALCRNESDIAAAIASQYSKVLRDPKVVVKIVDRTNRAVAIVDGAVKTPQRFQIKRAVRLNELIILSGGITDRSSGEITIFRPESLNCLQQAGIGKDKRETFVKTGQSNGSKMFNIRISDLLRGKEDANPLILSGDIV
ncbi:MAG: polysaccharide biosynthesis/export family protein, partial [Candidatus Binatia bacterium]